MMKCPVCGKETLVVCVHEDRAADILGCEECLPPELYNEHIVDLFEQDLKEMDIWLDGMEDGDDDADAAYWDKWNFEETLAIERAHGIT